jgi:hypothetical protein
MRLDEATWTDMESPFLAGAPFAGQEPEAAARPDLVESPFAAGSAWRAHAPQLEYEMEAPYTQEEEARSLDGLRQRVVDIARRECAAWGNGTRKETEPSMRDTLRKYWSAVLPAPAVEQAISDGSPWSAAFVSWVMKEAGAGPAFRYSAAHRVYVADGKAARAAADRTRFWTYRIREVPPAAGDVVCRDRGTPTTGACSGTTYDNVDDGEPRPSHGDIVVELRPGSVIAVGGNVSNSVAERPPISLDAAGLVAPTAGCQLFAITRPPGSADRTADVAPAPAVPRHLAAAVAAGTISQQAAIAIAGGNRDETYLTNVVFFARHTELPAGYRIQRHESHLARDWLRIREDIRALLRVLS